MVVANERRYHHRKWTSRRPPSRPIRRPVRSPFSHRNWTNFSGPVNWNYTYDGLYRVLAADNSTTSNSTDCNQSATAVTPVAGLHCYGYDAAGRLTSFRDATAARSASYDPDGNRLTYGDPTRKSTAPVTTATYTPDDAIATQTIDNGTPTAHTYQYAAPFGGISYDGCSSYTYDGFDRLTQATSNGGTACSGASSITYSYDALDRQSTRVETGAGATRAGTTTYGYDGLANTPSSETLPGGSTTRYTLTGSAGVPLAVANTSSGSQYLADDGRGNITTATTTAGALACAMRYDPWGNPLDAATVPAGQTCTNSGGSTLSDIRYAAGVSDPTTNTYQFGARTYDPSKAGFLTPDTYRSRQPAQDLSIGTDPLTRDTYNYVNGDPVNLIDPTGHRACVGDDVREGCREPNARAPQIRAARVREIVHRIGQLFVQISPHVLVSTKTKHAFDLSIGFAKTAAALNYQPGYGTAAMQWYLEAEVWGDFCNNAGSSVCGHAITLDWTKKRNDAWAAVHASDGGINPSAALLGLGCSVDKLCDAAVFDRTGTATALDTLLAEKAEEAAGMIVLDPSADGAGVTAVTGDDLATLRTEFNSVRSSYWKNVAETDPDAWSPEDLARMLQGRPPIGDDGYPMELHHIQPLSQGGSNDFDNLVPMTRTDHRLGPNYGLNHPGQ